MGEQLEEALTTRLREVLARQPTTESELRRLAEEGQASERLLAAELARREARLDALTADSASPLGEIADELRAVRDVRVRLAKLRRLLVDLENQAHELRADWAGAR